jgi:hypothetical protein
MGIPVPKLMLLTALVATAMVLGAGVQAAESIIFSTSQKSEGSNTPSLSPRPSGEGAFARQLSAPEPLFQPRLAPQHFPEPHPSVSFAEQQRLKKILEDRDNWTFLTPQEILGIKSDNSDTTQDDRTPMERYLERQEQQRTRNVTNSWRGENGEMARTRVTSDTNFSSGPGSRFGTIGNDLSRLLNGNSSNKNVPEQAENSTWNLSISSRPLQPSLRPDPAQQTAMNQFRQLLNPSFLSAAETKSDRSFVSAPTAAIDPYIAQPEYVPNPAGASFIPLLNNLGKPTGLNPLPGIVMPNIPSTTAPSWAPQPPPWLSPAAQPFAVPQRKF